MIHIKIQTQYKCMLKRKTGRREDMKFVFSLSIMISMPDVCILNTTLFKRRVYCDMF